MDYTTSDAVAKVGRKLIDRDPDHAHLQGLDFLFFFMSENPRPGKEQDFDPRDVLLTRHKWAEVKLKKASPDVATREAWTGVAEPWFTIAINKVVWDFLRTHQRRALLDEQLRRCELDPEKGTPMLKKPDVVAFVRNVEKYGTWYGEVEQLVAAARQAPEESE